MARDVRQIDLTGVSKPARLGVLEVIDLRNVSANNAFQADARLGSGFARRGGVTSYTFTRVRDVQMPLRSGAGTAD
jgi:hypothetical protein